MRTDRYEVGDVVEWHLPTVMASCHTWAPDVSRPTTIIAVEDIESAGGREAAGHSQHVRVSPNYCPYGDGFSGAWFKPLEGR